MFLKKISALVCTALLVLGNPTLVLAQEQQFQETFNFGANELDILKLIRLVANKTGKTIVIDPAVKGKVRIMTDKSDMTSDELYELFRTVLELSNFTVVEVGDVVKVIPIKEARTSPVSEASSASGLSEIVTDVISAENISAAKLLAALRPMVSTNANLAHHDGSNSLIITDTKANIDRIRRVIKKIDTAAVPTTEIIQLKYSGAVEMVETLNKLESKDKQAAGLSNKLLVVADQRNNAVLVSGEDLQRDRIKSLIRRLDRPGPQTGNVRVVYLEYADATKTAEVLTKIAQNLAKLGPGENTNNAANAATVEADEDTNALLITAEGETLTSLLAVVERLDIRRAQVLVEAIIVEINLTDGEEFGTEWLFANDDQGVFGGSSRGPQSTSLGVAQGLIGDDGADVGTLAGGIASIAGASLGLAGVNGSDNFLALVRALDTSSNANILSTPTLMTMDNHEAEISVGQEVPFATGSYASPGNTGNIGNPFTTFQREDVGILLKITPQINEGDKVLLNIEQEVSDIDSQQAANGGIVTKQSKIATQILASDGEIVVLGGLIQEEAEDSQQKVPVLGSIPILGYLFKYQSTQVTRNNLMVFLRAEIIRDDFVMQGATAEKYYKMQGILERQREQGLPLMDDKNIPLLPDISFDELNAETENSEAEKE